jgi:putative DNA primase/helicase
MYNEKHWVQRDDIWIDNFADTWIKPDPNNGECIEFKHKVKRNRVPEPEWLEEETPPQLVNFQNGTLDIKTGELLPHSSLHNFHNVFPYDYSPEGCPKTEEIVRHAFRDDPDAVEFFWRYLATCFDSVSPVECALFLIGAPATAKSTLLAVFQAVFPPEVRSSLTLADVCGDFRFKSHLLYKKLVNLSDEGIPHKVLDAANFKSVISGADIMHEQKGKDPFLFKCRTKFVTASNEVFNLTDSALNFKRKFEVINFEHPIPENERNPEVKRTWIPSERVGIAYKAIEKYKEMQREFMETGVWDLKATTKMQVGKEGTVLGSDEIETYFTHLKFGDDHTKGTLSGDVYTHYKHYNEDNGIRNILSRRKFVERLKRHMGVSRWDALYSTNIQSGANKGRGFRGLELLNADGDVIGDEY